MSDVTNLIEVGYVREIQLVSGKTHYIKTLSMRPALFEIENFLSDEECDDIIFMAKTQGLEDSRTLLDGVFKVNESVLARIAHDPDAAFTNNDANEDGVLDKGELVHSIGYIGDIRLTNEDLDRLIEDLELDTNKDGVLSREEHSALLEEGKLEKILNYTKSIKQERPSSRSRVSNTAFLSPLDHLGKKELFESIKKRIQKVSGLPRDIIWTSEDLQVLRYDKNGHYHTHYDSEEENDNPTIPCCHYFNHLDDDNCIPCRYMTFFYYLNEPEEGGETAFPIADNDTTAPQVMRSEKRHLFDLSNHCHEAKITYKPKKGAALFWYNHFIDENTGWLGEMDKMSYHGGCDVIKGTKWAANNWINVGKNRELDSEAWKNYKEFIDDYDQQDDMKNEYEPETEDVREGKGDRDMANLDVTMDTAH
ncbi:transmembrane prolyl 4-hydroxylase-like isoform X2 [Actinia tenebrosa]|uniref:Transmembrane prolyl 4-hydroxylase-like isoform X2 n=1 Tax=Actinia tenebrosa TaxID=6105 RepID=A0A6P8HKL4_ACTTE|nr:transmembrane prolyl 4-hydroxylase-like isoform X2 [Actinia tenebrosa]